MKKILVFTLLFSFIFVRCNEEDFLQKTPTGVLSFEVLSNQDGIDALLIGAYAALDGWVGWGAGQPWQSSASNWVWGDVPTPDAHRGSDAGDQPDLTPVERFTMNASNSYVLGMWRSVYDGVARANDVLRAVQIAEDDGTISAEQATSFRAEARFLRGHYHFWLQTVFENIPILLETDDDVRQPNFGADARDPFTEIEADLAFAASNLPSTQSQVGRITSGAANAVLARAHMYQNDFASARPLLDAVINSGLYSLTATYNENFDADFNNNEEAVFQVQNSVNDGAPENDNGRWGDQLNFPHGGLSPYSCCGFFQPTQNLLNAFQVDANGLPLITFDGTTDVLPGSEVFNQNDVTSDDGLSSNDPFTEHTGPLDPRVDWTIGRRGIPYLGQGDHPGSDWIRDQAFSGALSPKKNVFTAAQTGALSNAGGGWHITYSAQNTTVVRLADVLLMRAEIHAADGELATAMGIVNDIRTRASNSAGFVKEADGTTNAANYQIGLYQASHPAFSNQNDCIKAVRFERRMELAMEGYRFFDLRRWGVAATVINDYLEVERNRRPGLLPPGTTFTAGKNEIWPIPISQIDDSFKDGEPTLQQNPGF